MIDYEQLSERVLQEVTTPLTVMTGRISLLENRLPGDNNVRLIGDAADEITGAFAILRDIQAKRTGTFKPLDVLVVDDEQDVGKAVEEMIRLYGDNAVFAIGGPSGIEDFSRRLDASRTSPPSAKAYDLVLTDLRMPQVTGYDVVKAVKAMSPYTPVHVLTGNRNHWEDECAKKGPLNPDGMHDKPLQDIRLFGVLAQTRQRIGGYR